MDKIVPVNKKSNFFIILISVLIFLMPTSPSIGGFQLWYLVTIFLMLGVSFQYRIVENNVTREVFLFLKISFVLLVISLLISGGSYGLGDIRDLNEVFRILGCGAVFGFTYKYFDSSKYTLLVKFFKFFLVIQLVVCFLEGIGSFVVLFEKIWDLHKVWDLRRTGTFANPNILSLFAISAWSFIFFVSENKYDKYIYFVLAIGIILFTSSKTGLLSLMIMVNINYFLNKEKVSFISVLKVVVGILLLGYVLLQLLIAYADDFPYLAQLLALFDSNYDVESIRSIDLRHSIWHRSFKLYENFDFLQLLFGSGPAKTTVLNIIDNEYYTILIKMGYTGVVLYIVYLLRLTVFSLKNRAFWGGKMLLSLIVLFLLASYSASTFMAWYLSLMFFFFLGVSLKNIVLNRNN